MKIRHAWVVQCDDNSEHTIVENYRQPPFCKDCISSSCQGVQELKTWKGKIDARIAARKTSS